MCYSLSGEPEDDDDMRNVNILKLEGIFNVVAPEIPTDPMSQPLKIQKFNIRIEENQSLLVFGTIGMRRPWQESWTFYMNFKIPFRLISHR